MRDARDNQGARTRERNQARGGASRMARAWRAHRRGDGVHVGLGETDENELCPLQCSLHLVLLSLQRHRVPACGHKIRSVRWRGV